jgi:hypothetical protein
MTKMTKKDCYNFDCEENINGACKRYDRCVNQCGREKRIKEQTALELIKEASFETEPDKNNSDRAVNLTIAECMIIKAKKEVFDEIEKELYNRDKDHFEYNIEATFKKLEELRRK